VFVCVCVCDDDSVNKGASTHQTTNPYRQCNPNPMSLGVAAHFHTLQFSAQPGTPQFDAVNALKNCYAVELQQPERFTRGISGGTDARDDFNQFMLQGVINELRWNGFSSLFSATWLLRTVSESARVKQKMGVGYDWEPPLPGDGVQHGDIARAQQARTQINLDYIWAPNTRHICQPNWKCVELAINALKGQNCPFGICQPEGNRSSEAQPIACVVLALNQWYRLRDLSEIFPCELGLTNGSRGLLLYIGGDDPLNPNMLLMYVPTYCGPSLLSDDVWTELQRSSVVQQAMAQEQALGKDKIVPVLKQRLATFATGTVLVIYLHLQHNNCEKSTLLHIHTPAHTARWRQLQGLDCDLQQFPCELNKATTAASALGCEFDQVFADLGPSDFALFNSLVMLSRATSWKNLTLADFNVSRLTNIMKNDDKRRSFRDVVSFVTLLNERCSHTTDMLGNVNHSDGTVQEVLYEAKRERERVAEDERLFEQLKKLWDGDQSCGEQSWESVFQEYVRATFRKRQRDNSSADEDDDVDVPMQKRHKGC
jgi:hypothetical protein